MPEIAASVKRHTVLLVWADPCRGIRSVSRTVSGLLRDEPHNLATVEVDLPEALTGHSIVQTLASWTGMQRETVAVRGWPVVQQQLAGELPQVVVALDPVAAAAVDTWRKEDRLRAPLVGLTFGLRLDPAWARTAVDRLAVADEQMGEEAVSLGLPAECVVPAGIPVCGGFSSVSPDEKERLRGKFKLPLTGNVALVVTDGLESDELTGALFQLSLLPTDTTVMFDVARHDEAAQLLRRRAALYDVQARMFGKVEEAGELWAAADVVVARPQIYVEQRAVALRLPYIHLLPQGEEQREMARVYVERGVGRVVEHLSTLATQIELQLAPEALAQGRRRMARISRRVAAVDIARLVAQVGSQADQILNERYRPAVVEPATRATPLETIGGSVDPSQPVDPVARLADLEAAEAEANRQVTEHQREVDLWTRRAGLAEERGAADLLQQARRLVDRHRDAMHRALAELARLAEQRRSLERKASSRVEQEFRDLELEDALAALKRRMESDDE